jgi:3-oxoadipate enol-lactonase
VVWDCPGRPGAPVVLLVHGVTLTTELNWSAVLPGLAGPFRVLAFDQRGHGHGLGWTHGYRLEDCADDVAAIAAALGINRVILVGYSMGGLIAQLVWHRHRQLTAGLVLCATARNMAGSRLPHPATLMASALLASALLPLTPGAFACGWVMPGLAALGQFAPGPPLPDIVTLPTPATLPWLPATALRADLLGRQLLDTDGDPAQREWALAQMRRTSLGAALAAVSAVYRFSSHAWVGEIDVPTAVIIPRGDRIVAPTRQHKLAAAVPGAITLEVDGAHGIFLTAPDRFLAAVSAACDHAGAEHATPAVETPPATAS